MVDIANSFHEKGFDCVIIAGRVVERDNHLNTDILIQKIKQYDRTSNTRRVISWLVGTVQILFITIFRYRKSHLFIVSNPPFATLLPLFFRNEFSLLIFDLFPDALVEFGIVKENSLLRRFWARGNRVAYKKATHIFTLTSGMKQALSKYTNPEKISVTPLWTSNSFIKPVPKDSNIFIKNHSLQGKFIVLYSGNFGIAHYIKLIVDLASKITDPQIMFVIIGGGPEEAVIRNKVKYMELKNCIILPWQDIKMLPYSLASADLSIVTLSENALKLGIPSKLFTYMSVGSPVLAITGTGSDLEKIIVDYDIGKSFPPSCVNEMIEYIHELKDNPELCSLYHNNSLSASGFHTIKNVDLITRCYV
jgi:glycosyltransferase involved in cell wall biosynthesis